LSGNYENYIVITFLIIKESVFKNLFWIDLWIFITLHTDKTEAGVLLNEYNRLVQEGLEIKDRTQRSEVTEAPVKQCKPHFAKPPNRCCNDGHEHSEEFKQIKKECFAEIKDQLMSKKNDSSETEPGKISCEKAEKIKSKVVCAMECMSKKQNVVRVFSYKNSWKKICKLLKFFFTARWKWCTRHRQS